MELTLGGEYEINHRRVEGAFEELYFPQILLVFLSRDERLRPNLLSSSLQSSDFAVRVLVMIPELLCSCQRNMPALQIIPKGLGIADPTECKKGTSPYFAERTRNLLVTCEPESMQTRLSVKNRTFVRILGFYVRPLGLAGNDENVSPAAS